ncbi:hypothetical protein MNBD_GAMMA23-1262 [hydrothermal vent metagenome]|uniref:PrcB C-terminal domain-containing protein n=1 Tax=hydrothermal vent metagenome TaxID=652676 RepID=A0A3B1AB68_9ZZZZ
MNKQNNLNPLLYFLFFLLTSCGTTNTGSSTENELYTIAVNFNVIANGQHSNISLARQLVVKNKSDWQHLWDIHSGNKKQQRPRINFDDDMVIAIFAGQQPSGGYTLGVSRLKKLDDNLTVLVTFKEPPQDGVVSLALTQPYIFISTAKVDGKVIFKADMSPLSLR